MLQVRLHERSHRIRAFDRVKLSTMALKGSEVIVLQSSDVRDFDISRTRVQAVLTDQP